MSVHVHVTNHGTDTIIAIDGTIDGDLLIHLADGIVAVADEAAGRVIVDLGVIGDAERTAVHQLVDQPRTAADGRGALLASTDTTRQFLREWNIDTRIPVHHRLPGDDDR